MIEGVKNNASSFFQKEKRMSDLKCSKCKCHISKEEFFNYDGMCESCYAEWIETMRLDAKRKL